MVNLDLKVTLILKIKTTNWYCVKNKDIKRKLFKVYRFSDGYCHANKFLVFTWIILTNTERNSIHTFSEIDSNQTKTNCRNWP